MIVVDVEQGSPAWIRARLGIPTASGFRRLLTQKTRKLAAGAEAYMHELLAEWLIGQPIEEDSGFMQRGTALEAWAVSWYELQRDLSTAKVGLILRDDRMVGCSPDRLVGEQGGLEIKCPSAAQHVAYALGDGLLDAHFAQVQGALWLTGRRWWDLVSYHPEIQPVIVRVERDEEYIRLLDATVTNFVQHLLLARESLERRGCVPQTPRGLPAGMVHDEEPF